MNTADTARRAKRITRCAEAGCPETPTGGTHRTGKPACRRHATTESLLPIRPDPPPKATDGMISPRAVEAASSDGKPHKGAHGWEHDEPRASPGDHAWFPIVVNQTLMWQQGPPVHVRGAAPASAPGAHVIAASISEDEAHRQALAIELGQADPTALGYSSSKLRRARKGRRK